MFFSDLKDSFYNPLFYSSLRARKLGSSFKYFFKLVALIAILMAFVMGVELSPVFSSNNLKKFAELYPVELVVTVKGGAVSTNAVEPYAIKANAGNPLGVRYANLVVIDTKVTKGNFTIDQLKQYDTAFFVGKDIIVASKHQGQLEINDISRLPDFTVSSQTLSGWADSIGSHHLGLSLGLFALLFIAFFLYFTGKLIWFFLLALIVLLIARAKRVPLTYKESYQITLHAATVPFILEALLILTGIGSPFLLFFSLILLLIVFANIKSPPPPPVTYTPPAEPVAVPPPVEPPVQNPLPTEPSPVEPPPPPAEPPQASPPPPPVI